MPANLNSDRHYPRSPAAATWPHSRPPPPLPQCRSSSGSDREGSLGKSPAAAPSPLTAALSPLTAGAVAGSAANFALAGGACLVVRFGLCEVAGLGLHHLQPNVHYEPATRTACVFR